MTSTLERISLIGAGLNGSLLAILLRQRGFELDIFERRPDMRLGSASAGRSINLALSTRGIFALQQAGLWESLQEVVVPMKGRMMHSVQGELTFQPYGRSDVEVIHSISRADLNIALLNAAENHGAQLHFRRRCTGIDLKTGAVSFRDELSEQESTIDTGIVIACDGSTSAIRSGMLSLQRFNFSQTYLDYGYKELTIPAGTNGNPVLETAALHIWPRGNFVLIALPNVDGTFACILFMPFDGSDGFSSLSTSADVNLFFRTHFPDAQRMMPGLGENYFANPTSSMVTVKCFPWHVGNNTLLLGDAAHAIVPFFGQGINCGFEDCTTLLRLLDEHKNDWPAIFAAFETERKSNCDAIADLAIENFIEMRDRVADPAFLLRKKVELALQEKYPQLFIPKYAMVTFHRIPYAVAAKRGELQDAILKQLCESIERVDDLDWLAADRLIHRDLTTLPATV